MNTSAIHFCGVKSSGGSYAARSGAAIQERICRLFAGQTVLATGSRNTPKERIRTIPFRNLCLCLCALVVSLSASAADDSARWTALAMVESGPSDTASGPSGEISRYQISRTVWRQYTALPLNSGRNPSIALNLSQAVMTRRVAAFTRAQQRPPTDAEWYLLWHRPARALHPLPAERARADRFVNVLKSLAEQSRVRIVWTNSTGTKAIGITPHGVFYRARF